MSISKSKLLAYAASGSAIACFAQTADGDLVFNNGDANFGGVAVDGSSFDIDFDEDGTNDFTFFNSAASGTYAAQGGVGIEYGATGAGVWATNVDSFASAGASSQSVDATLSFQSAGYFAIGTDGQFAPGDTGFVGLQFTLANGDVHFGFAEILMSTDVDAAGDPTNAFTVLNYAWNDMAGVAAHFEQPSAVPEPGSLSFLALGASGLALLRRRKKSVA